MRLFRSNAHYWDKRGPISWDMAMTATAADWRPQVKAGDQLRISATYETRRASWYESMGIMVVWEAWNDHGRHRPVQPPLDQAGHVTHGHLPENNHHGGSTSLSVNLKKFPTCSRSKVMIGGFHTPPGTSPRPATDRCTPTVRRGQALTFVNNDAFSAGPFSIVSPSSALHALRSSTA